ncbi:MAG: hypothetical protein M1825_005221 [Sarcosagium campestre]|nr:MAG: hypothetical protein M1825_005221 [Sarcosagium campestre]
MLGLAGGVGSRASAAVRASALGNFKDSFKFPAASHSIDILTGTDAPVGREVIIHGYLGERADLSKNLFFVPITDKDLKYTIQIISQADKEDGARCGPHWQLKRLSSNSAIAIRGILKIRVPPKNASSTPKDPFSIRDHEIQLQQVFCLNEFPKDIIAKKDTKFPPEKRHLQIRTERDIRDGLRLRGKVSQLCRNELDRVGFLEVETPLLFKSTPEGAREFLVPTRQEGLAYALPQSPQQYKQILMASGIPRYYQIARCFRDEDLRADRQPEFTQLDLEMSFASGNDVKSLIDLLIRKLWADILGFELPAETLSLSYDKAMQVYGSDKPDTRLGAEISNLDYLPTDMVSKITSLSNPVVEAFKLHISDDASETQRFVASFMDSPQARSFNENPDGAPGIVIIDNLKPLQGLQPLGFEAADRLTEQLDLTDGDLVVLQARPRAPHHGSCTALGNLRLALHRAGVSQGHLDAPIGFSFLWITDFPLFSPASTAASEPGQGGNAGFASTHHPFTSPASPADVDLLLTDPSKARAEHYDLVVNGVELGGGSRRIHDARVQEFVLRDVLKMPPHRLSEFSHLLEVLRAGCPPHAGIALGFDRLVAVMLGRTSVRDVIAFPKNGNGEDPLVGSPSRFKHM